MTCADSGTNTKKRLNFCGGSNFFSFFGSKINLYKKNLGGGFEIKKKKKMGGGGGECGGVVLEDRKKNIARIAKRCPHIGGQMCLITLSKRTEKVETIFFY